MAGLVDRPASKPVRVYIKARKGKKESKKKGSKTITAEGLWGAGETYSMAKVLLFAPLIHTFFGGLPELGHTSTLTHFKNGGRRKKKFKENLMRWGALN